MNKVTPNLFAKYPGPRELAAAKQEDVEKIIHSTGFFRAKATNIREMSRKLVDEFDGVIPRTVEELIKLVRSSG